MSDLSFDPSKKFTDLSNFGFVHCLIWDLWIWDLWIWALPDVSFMDLWQRRCIIQFRDSLFITDILLQQEHYILQQGDLYSGIGGIVGLWLGCSILMLGDYFVKLLEALFHKINTK